MLMSFPIFFCEFAYFGSKLIVEEIVEENEIIQTFIFVNSKNQNNYYLLECMLFRFSYEILFFVVVVFGRIRRRLKQSWKEKS